MDMGAQLGEYFMFGMDPQSSMGGMSNAAETLNVPAHWLHYVLVPDADAAVKKVVDKGGKVLHGPHEVPGGDRIAQCQDPQGGMFAVVSSPAR
ncbi:Putative hydroxylase [Vulgatibacter incomptus]|uniref:Putative hydroxylase n=1 Tax=Vulgatibacter incomptus TaxID=1391653 RepID=A0A0K1PIC8_9BACT|nr:Putative hydroxylase [Vulgatibacter incomptus]